MKATSKAKQSANPQMLAGVIMDGIDVRAASKAASAGADSFELRIDSFKDTDTERLAGAIKDLGRRVKRPLILTVRSAKEGGAKKISDEKRLEIYGALMPFVDFADIELSSMKIIKNVVKSARKHNKKIIVSFHDFKGTPAKATLNGIVRRARRAGADIVKIACRADSNADLNALALVLLENRSMIVIPMGAFGRPGRLFFPTLGSMVSYCPVKRASAPGQLTISQFKDITRRII